MEPSSKAWRSLWEQLGAERPVQGDEQLQLRGLTGDLAIRAATGDRLAYTKCEAALWRFRCLERDQNEAALLNEGRHRSIIGGSKEEQWHTDLLSELVGLTAEDSPDVPALRLRLFGRPDPPFPSLSAAGAFLNSPLLRFFTKEHLDGLGIPLIGHKAKLLSNRVVAQAELVPGSKSSEQIQLAEIQVSWGGKKKRLKYGKPAHGRERLDLEYADDRGHRVAVEVEPFSVLGEIQWAAERLTEVAEPCSAWWPARSGAAPAFVVYLLTGVVPKLRTILAFLPVPGSGTDVVTINAFVHADPESVKAVFAKAQRQHGEGRVAPPRRAALVPFVESKWASDDPRPKWNDLFKEWNKTAPARWRYQSWRNMWRDYQAETRLLSQGLFGDLTYAERVLAVLDVKLKRMDGGAAR